MVALNTRRQRQEDFCEFETNVGYKQRTLHLTTPPPPRNNRDRQPHSQGPPGPDSGRSTESGTGVSPGEGAGFRPCRPSHSPTFSLRSPT